jgi:hypothetical protein
VVTPGATRPAARNRKFRFYLRRHVSAHKRIRYSWIDCPSVEALGECLAVPRKRVYAMQSFSKAASRLVAFV